MSFRFEKLTIWKIAMDFGEETHKLAHKLPIEELFNISSQIRRASDSIALNISEGSIGQSDREFNRFMGYAIRSLAEVVSCLYKCKRRNYITEEEFKKLYDNSFYLMNMMTAFRNKLKK
jgi:four helix bundle protein